MGGVALWWLRNITRRLGAKPAKGHRVMPSRILRDWTDSYRLEKLSAEAERLFVRVIMKADDFGRFHADTRLLKAQCFPLLSALRDTDISRWLAECEKAGLLAVYQAKGRKYLAVVEFKQRARQEESKFPAPDGMASDWLPTFDGQVTVIGQSTASLDGDVGADEGACGGADGKPPPPVMVFPCRGGQWALTEVRLAQFREVYGKVDIPLEFKKALLWLQNNRDRQKTSKGMPNFLTNWLNRAAQDSLKPTPATDDADVHSPEFLAQAFKGVADANP